MAEIAELSPVAETPKKGKKVKGDKQRTKTSHPPTAVMVNSAIKSLKERGGSSLQAIKKYISSTYKVDAEKLAPFIKKAIKSSVASGSLVQTKGKGASGSFKLAAPGANIVKTPKAVTRSAPSPASKKKSSKKQTKSKVSPKKASPKAKTPSKAKKAPITPVKKPKSPKAKTAKKPVKGKKASPKKK